MTQPRLFRLAFPALFSLALLAMPVRPLMAQAPRTSLPLEAEHYDISARLDADTQTIAATAQVDFRARESTSLLNVELHPNLVVKEVTGPDGKALPFQRDNVNPLIVNVNLPAPVPANGKVTLTFTYAGMLANQDNTPIPGVRAALINKDGAYLLLPARWFPLTNYPSNRYTATFHLDVPDSFAVAGSGKADAPTPAASKRLLYTFHCDTAAAHGTFVAGSLQLNPQQAEGVSVAVYAPKSDSANAGGFADDVARAVTLFSDMFGPLPTGNSGFTVIQIPDGTVRAFAGPGVLLLSRRLWEPKGSARLIAGLVASQWWGNAVMPASRGDVWITDGLARYCEELFAEENNGKEAGLRAIDEFSVGALMYEDAAPVSQAARLIPYTPDYRSVVLNKGAMIFNMLRGQMGDAAFKALLHDFYAKYVGRTASIDDFEAMADQVAQAAATPAAPAPNVRGFFLQWLNSTGVPDFSFDYVVYRTVKGFRIVGKIKQSLDTFSMPVELRIETEGNPEIKTIDVIGTETAFTVETFGRPKAGGIKIDPNNFILKGSSTIRARAAIARGEELAEQGHYFEAIAQYQKALSIQPNRPLANFRMGEAFFYQKNYQSAANSFRESLATVPEPSEKWTEVWAHIYLGEIFDLLGQRARAVNEYSKAKQTNDNTGNAQQIAEAYTKKPYTEGAVSASTPAGGGSNPPPPADTAPAPASSPDDRPVLKKRTPNPS